MFAFIRRPALVAAAAGSALLLSACAAKVIPPPPPPPPPPVVVPLRPMPPSGAAATMYIPGLGFDGVRETVNARLTPAQITWNVRSALNVAALNCFEPRHALILEAYKSFLTTHARGLSATNRALDSEFRQKFGATYHDARDRYMTQVYNYFALPPALPQFCDVAAVVAQESLIVPPADLDAFASRSLPQLEAVYEGFFRAFEQYRVDVAAWDAQYGPAYPAPTATGYTNPLDPAQSAAAYPAPAPTAAPVPTLTLPAPPPPLVVPAPAATGTLVLPVPAAGASAAYGPPQRR